MNLTTKNIFYSLGKIKLCDFGLVSVSSQKKYMPLRNIPYTGILIPTDWLNYQAPEILKFLSPLKHGLEARLYTIKTDIYAFGIVYYELVRECVPRINLCAEALIYNVCTNSQLNVNSLDPITQLIIVKCLQDESKRYNYVSEIEENLSKMPRRHFINRAPSQPTPIKLLYQ
uniref:Kinase suppressor of Ras 1 (Trinotate prediction) n=1 Tax=Henneguya salminicola TaxID=69463 RepID=A0A6G3MJ90_HENSL